MAMRMGTLLIRADASSEIGTGHVMRCLALAQAWQDAGGNVVFAMAESTPSVMARLARENCVAVRIDAAIGSPADADCLLDWARIHGSDWIVLDGYSFSATYQRRIKDSGAMLLCIDDNGISEKLSADLLLNQNLHAREELYSNKPATELLLGPTFSLLRREFNTWKGWRREIQPNVRRILVTMGGSDPANLSGTVLQSMAQLGDAVEIVLVVGGSNSRFADLRTQAARFGGRLRLEIDPLNMTPLLAWADLAISAAGATCWEMCMLGLPAIVIDAADCQLLLARELDRQGLALHLPKARVTVQELARKIDELMHASHLRSDISTRSSRLVDGGGPVRVVQEMRSRMRQSAIVASQAHNPANSYV
jgi:UDP-2,4-diacetamido-2,4,6-trideoxy-beta-L-altropyranose hydrolase